LPFDSLGERLGCPSYSPPSPSPLFEELTLHPKGRILLDGHDIKTINVQWMRDHVGLVSQQPVLFPVSIRANIASGLPNITDEMIINAARLANAHDFISNFPDGYDTVVGDQGAQLSGGQRQRIAIARALLKDPQILLLDEATSALDNESEAVVQEALERASIARTTIVIAHRLSTIVNADRILVMDGGVIVEEGRHEELLALKGRYYAMVEQQNLSTSAVVQRRSMASVDFSAGAGKKMVRKSEDKDQEDQGKKEDREVEELTQDKSMVWWVAKLSAPDWLYITIGVISAGLEGLVWPIFSVIFSQIMAILVEGGDSGQTRIYVLAFVGVGVASFVAMFLKFNCLAMAGERLTLRLRMAAFNTILARPMSWFDAPNHTKAILGSRLANDASDVKGVLSGRLGLTIQLLSTMFGGLGVALYFCWRVALVVLSTFPIVAIGGALQLKVMTGFSQSKAYEKSSHYAAQAVDNIRTVVALGRLRGFYEEYVAALKLPTSGIQRVAWVQGACFGVTEFCMFAVWALAFWYGSTLVDKNQCSFADMMKALTGVLFGAMMSGQLQVCVCGVCVCVCGVCVCVVCVCVCVVCVCVCVCVCVVFSASALFFAKHDGSPCRP
jgi:ATP-binding cassette, subfamily B (MDR/TAP), member 1